MRPVFKVILRRVYGIILGGLFCYTGYVKLFHVNEFAEAVLTYRLLPLPLVGIVAAAIPVLELSAGFFLVLGLLRRSCLLVLGWLTGIFLLAMFITLARGLKIDCGCGLFFGRQVGLAPILEDIVILLWAAGLYYWELIAAEAAARPAAPAESSGE